MECAICFNQMSDACILTCTHHFCYSCIHKWCFFKNTCPKCRAIIYDIKFDREFDMLINGDSLPKILKVNKKKNIEITFPIDSDSGITIKNNTPGVRVIKVNSEDQFFKCGIRENDVILFINNVPCTNHYDVIEIINKYQKSNIPITLYLK
jgi:hypothetical protein